MGLAGDGNRTSAICESPGARRVWLAKRLRGMDLSLRPRINGSTVQGWQPDAHAAWPDQLHSSELCGGPPRIYTGLADRSSGNRGRVPHVWAPTPINVGNLNRDRPTCIESR